MDKAKCPKCGYEWIIRVEHPKECPHCKARIYKAENNANDKQEG